MKTKANLLLAGSALLLGLTGKSGKTKTKLPNVRGSQNTRLPEVPLQVVNSPFSTKETIGVVDRWMNKLQIPKQQKLVMQKSLRSLPTDAKGRITKDQIEQLFAKGTIPYTVQILRDKLGTSDISMENQFENVIKSFLSDFGESPWNMSPSEQTSLLHQLMGDILSAYHAETDDDSFIENLYLYGLEPMTYWFEMAKFGYVEEEWSEEIRGVFEDKMDQFAYDLEEIRILVTRGQPKETKYSKYSILQNIELSYENAQNIEVIVYPKLEEMLQDDFVADGYNTVLSLHYRGALFWFRGFILDGILYVQELQNDHASTYKKPLVKIFDSPVDKTKFKHDITKDDAFWWSLTYGEGTDSKGRDFWINPATPSRFQVPPTDWVRSDILLAFAVAASLGLNKVAFCDATASLIAVGGKEKGQKYFYDKFVPEKVKSVAKKYGIIQEGIITLPLKNNSKTVKCQSWEMPDNLMRFFREQGYPIFG